MVLVLWDVDQTLLDLGAVDREVWYSLCADLVGVPPRPATVVPGRTIRQILRDILREYGAAPETADRLLPVALEREAEALARRDLRTAGRLLPGVPEVVAALDRDPTVVQSVLTGNQLATTRLKLAAFDLVPPLDLRYGAFGSDREHRPDLVPVARERTAAAYGPGAAMPTVLVGDSVLDVDAAHRNDARVVAVATGFTPAAELRAAGADVVLDDLGDLPRSLAAILGEVAA
ncbi:HAD family hydrolase [Actinocatenispora rupis]|uniref:Haloacid dehalogenase n=1 Tax=Actinocatenispora rupis TaxID=519421 RepID=A0A8J3J5R5_9ACTN|nr:HAD hydrolase-like protein [Actinocatenispora rupis]GID15255.1 haloacid dehalogenase [Actinocatenispora rupis]